MLEEYKEENMKKTLGKQFYITIVALIVGIFLIQRVPHGKTMSLQKDIENFELQIGSWKGGPHSSFDPKVLDVLRVDDYLNRTYYNEAGEWISLYVGYFRDQKEGETIHSPRNCMPGSGWNFTQNQVVTFDIEGKEPLTFQVLRSVLVSGEERMLTYYWYQSRGRFLTSEYWHKIYLVLDAIRYNRTDGALVRVLAPLPKEGDIDKVEAQVKDFITTFTPILQYEYFPPAVGHKS
jgi:EpsI family protein